MEFVGYYLVSFVGGLAAMRILRESLPLGLAVLAVSLLGPVILLTTSWRETCDISSCGLWSRVAMFQMMMCSGASGVGMLVSFALSFFLDDE